MIERIWTRRSGAGARSVELVRHLLPDAEVGEALTALEAWPGYRPTPLRRLPAGARRARVGEVLYKDESGRFGAGSFKAAGAAYEVQRAVEQARAGGEAQPTVCCATDGNHGRAVAWAARHVGGEAVVYLPAHALPERERRIRALGARTVRVDGTYDEAVDRVRADAARHGWVLVSDTSDESGDAGNLRIMAGYALIVEEVLDALDGAPPPTHAFLQAGVGTMAAALTAQLARRLGERAPRIVLVEPARAACVTRSLAADRDAPLDTPLDTVMDCLAAGRVSATAWPVLRSWVDAAVTIDDDACAATLAQAAAGAFGERLDVGPSGVAGLTGLLAAAAEDASRGVLSLDASSRVLVVGTEEALPPG